jgi:hypothetical protein
LLSKCRALKQMKFKALNKDCAYMRSSDEKIMELWTNVFERFWFLRRINLVAQL